MAKEAAPRKRKNKVVQLTIVLLKTGMKIDDVINSDAKGEVRRIPIDIDGRELGLLVVKQTPEHPPDWANFFSDAVDLKRRNIRNASVSAIFITHASNRTFVLCFGHGRHLINEEAMEERFGLRVTLNTVDPEHLRAVDVTTIESNPVHGRRQPARAAPLGDFGLNLDQDLMRGVSGKPLDDAYGASMSGANSLSTRVRTDLHSVRKLLSRYLIKSEEETYKERFAWVDHVSEVHDARLKNELFESVIGELGSDNSFIWSAIPEIVDWTLFDFFRFGTPASHIQGDDVTLDRLLESIGDETPSLEILKRKQVFCFAKSNPHPMMHWSFLKCLTAELPRNGIRYLLNAGTWFRIDQDFASRVESDVDEIPYSAIRLGDWGDETETDYNRRIAKNSVGKLALMDREMIMHPGMVTPIEFCDLMSTTGQMIHVKRYGQSSVLSHLFAQGTVAATTALSDLSFRHALNKKLPKSHQFKDPALRPDPSKLEICFAIGSSHPGKLRLPFFSQVTLRNAYRALHHALGIRVTLMKITMSKLTDVGDR